MDSDQTFSFSIDRGGTFTDVYAQCPGGKVRVMKLLSEDPANYQDAPREAIRRIIEEEVGINMPQSTKLDSKYINWIRMGTTVATNALLERKGEKCALVTTAGFKDLLHIGNQSRPNLFDLSIEMPNVIYEEVVEVEERVCLVQDTCQLGLNSPIVTGTTGEKLHVWKSLDKDRLTADLKGVLSRGIKCLAVVLLHSYTFREHEETIGRLAKEMGFTHISLSSSVMPMVRIVPRGYTACADAYLTPCIQRYINTFLSGFGDPEQLRVLFMQSDGGLTPTDRFIGSRAILSGPAGGVVGYAMTTLIGEEGVGDHAPIIGFDMGGTSTDVSRYHGNYEHVFEATTAGISIQAPQLDINTVAAGGGSVLSFCSGLFAVGPESAGANPGPACYGKGGPLTVTDANLCLGRLLPEYFPKIFGPNEDQPLDKDTTMRLFQDLTDEINHFPQQQQSTGAMTLQEVALGFIRVANETMCRPIRALTQAKGYNTAQHVLACFGGAGGQHACAIAKSLGMATVFVHRYSGILSAYGLALADVVHESQEPCARVYEESSFKYIDEHIDSLSSQCIDQLESQGFARDSIETTPFLNLRYDRTDCAIMCTADPITDQGGVACSHGDFLTAFNTKYQMEFGFTIPSRLIVVDDIRVRGVAKACAHSVTPLSASDQPPNPTVTTTACFVRDKIYNTSVNVYLFDHLTYGHMIQGPAIIIDKCSTVWVEPGSTASLTKFGDIKIEVGRDDVSCNSIGTQLDTVHLSIFSHRFMSIAEQMGRVLQRTSISTNIKERLDFSCALFGPNGGLVANAPHIPVHLGAMQETVQYQMGLHGDGLKDGDVILCNHPGAGGSHLPDLTIITPVFYKDQQKPVFFVANRGHHADVGGISPGSIPPESKYLWEEGMAVKSFKLVENGVFQEEACIELLMSPSKHPGCSGARNLSDNLSDLRAQVAANQKGITLVKELIDAYGLDVVQSYMQHIQENAEVAVKRMLVEVATQAQPDPNVKIAVLKAVDQMDDGTEIKVAISINKEDGSTSVDFTGTGKQVATNCNAPRAVTMSALIYSLRCLVKHDIPLNQGCLNPISVNIPYGSILSPADGAAVVGGNVQTSQRIVDVLLKAFSACAASQGCMNNIVFGDSNLVYYETVAGGAGAGPSWNGRSGIHTHMTNTRITDPEILERRFPIILKRFHLNEGTGGRGLYKGGDGVIRELMFRRPLTLCVLSERREFAPYGMCGGEPGRKGVNILIKRNGDETVLGGKSKVNAESWDTFRLETPGGGGYGEPVKGEGVDGASPPHKKPPRVFEPSGSISTYQRLQESA